MQDAMEITEKYSEIEKVRVKGFVSRKFLSFKLDRSLPTQHLSQLSTPPIPTRKVLKNLQSVVTGSWWSNLFHLTQIPDNRNRPLMDGRDSLDKDWQHETSGARKKISCHIQNRSSISFVIINVDIRFLQFFFFSFLKIKTGCAKYKASRQLNNCLNIRDTVLLWYSLYTVAFIHRRYGDSELKRRDCWAFIHWNE